MLGSGCIRSICRTNGSRRRYYMFNTILGIYRSWAEHGIVSLRDTPYFRPNIAALHISDQISRFVGPPVWCNSRNWQLIIAFTWNMSPTARGITFRILINVHLYFLLLFLQILFFLVFLEKVLVLQTGQLHFFSQKFACEHCVNWSCWFLGCKLILEISILGDWFSRSTLVRVFLLKMGLFSHWDWSSS